jgi:hypothetical protein
VKFREGLCKEKVDSVYFVPFMNTSGGSVRKYRLMNYLSKI